MDLTIFLLSAVVVVYLLAFVLFVLEFVHTTAVRLPTAGRFVEIGFLIHTLFIFAQTFTVSGTVPSKFHLPVTTLGETSGFFAWSLAFIYLILLRQFRTESFGLILAPILVLFLIPSFFLFPPNDVLVSYFHDTYFLLHILSAFFGYASFALSFISAVLYLILDRALKQKVQVSLFRKLPSLEDLEQFVFRTIFWGLLLLGCAIVVGILWAKSAFGVYILWEPKSFASLLTWGVYLVIIYLHEILEMKGRRLVLLSLSAFVLVLFTFIGTSLFQIGPHVGIW